MGGDRGGGRREGTRRGRESQGGGRGGRGEVRRSQGDGERWGDGREMKREREMVEMGPGGGRETQRWES